MHAPNTLETAGTEFWEQITEQYDLQVDPARRALLEKACRLLDVADRIDRELIDQPLMVAGSMKQQVANGLLTEYRQYIAGFTGVVRAMKLETVSENVISEVLPTRSTATRSAALKVVR